MKIKITEFAKRHFNPKFGGTKILDYTVEEFESVINTLINETSAFIDGYAPFCKLFPIKNFTDAKVGSLPITLENYQYIRSGYSARTEKELPIFSRWLELPLGKPKAEWLMLVLYSKEQIEKEANAENVKTELEFDADWGIVAILGQSHDKEELMKPETMIRNSGYNTELFQKELKKVVKSLIEKARNTEEDDEILEESICEILALQGKMAGGSGFPLNEEQYQESVKFWSKNATLK